MAQHFNQNNQKAWINTSRTILPKGIYFRGRTYQSQFLTMLRAATPGGRPKVHVSVDPANLSHILVREPFGRGYLSIPCTANEDSYDHAQEDHLRRKSEGYRELMRSIAKRMEAFGTQSTEGENQ